MRGALPTAALLLLASTKTALGATFVVSIGNNFGHADEPRLSYAEEDATEFADVLRRLGRVTGENTVLLTGEDAPSLRGVLLRMNARIRAAQGDGAPDHALVIYYSGHADAVGLHLGTTTLPFDELKAIVESSAARVRVLIVDSCRSGGITRIKGARPAAPFAIRLDDRLDAEGTAIITSSAGSEDSQESESLGASFFTHHFVNALRGAADRDHDTHVTLNEAYSYAYKETIRSTGRTLRLQHPTYLYDIKGKGDFVLTYLDDHHTRSGRLRIDVPGAYLIMEGHAGGNMIAELQVEERGTELLLSPGRYVVQKRAASSYREYQLELVENGRVQLETAAYEDLAYSRLLRKGGGTRTAIHRIMVSGAARGPMIEGHGVTPNVLLGYGLDLEWFSLGLGARWSMSRAVATGSRLASSDHEVALRLTAERYIDLWIFSLSLGLVAEGIYHRQVFAGGEDAPDRSSFAFGFGGLFAVEAELIPELILRIEGGPMSQVYRRGITRGGALTGDEIATPLTWWAGLGAGWRL